jgi:site-specific recombinase XerD
MRKITLRYPEFETVIEDYLSLDEFRALSVLTILSKRIAITSFLNHLGDNGITGLQNCLQKHVTSHLSSIATLSASTISGRCFIFRHFFNYLHQQGTVPYSGYELFPVIFTNKRERILSFYSVDEIRKVTSAVDRKTPSGKRDLAILLMAAELGIRSSDISRLRLEDIHWERDTIEFIQYKTKVFNQLPLLENVKYALIDYLKSVRPSCDSPYVFIGARKRSPFSNTYIHHFVSAYFVKAGIDISERKHGPHAMRHSLASNLLTNNTPMHVIKEVLGHTNLNTTKIYLNIDIDLLKLYALEVPYETV